MSVVPDASRVEHLPADSQRLLLVAAAEPIGDPTLLWRVADQLGLDAGTAGQRKMRTDHSRRHGHLSPPSPALGDLPRRLSRRPTERAPSWHLAHATLAPDEDVAVELQRSADRARARGDLAAAAAFLEQAARLTRVPARRVQPELTAAQAKHDAGAPDKSPVLLAAAEQGPLNELQHARLERLRAQLALALRRGSDAPPLLLRAAQRLKPLDACLARETYLEALAAQAARGGVI